MEKRELLCNKQELYIWLESISNNFDKLTNSPLIWSKYVNDYCEELSKDDNPINNILINGPITVNVCPSEEELLKCSGLSDMKPVRTFVYDKYPTITLQDGEEEYKMPIWMSSAMNEVFMDYGWMNRKRYTLSKYSLGNSTPHSFLGGASGSGKSVCNNNIICNMLVRYAPWELELYMSDAKKVEFSRYSSENSDGEYYTMPHIRCVAAAEDQSYAITMMEYIDKLTNDRQKIFAKVGVQNIKDFRKVTGLCMPRIVVALEEVQFMFSKVTPKEKNKILEIFNKMGTASRNAGVHLHLTSQSVGEVNKEIMKNIGLRGALKCNAEVSTKLIRNSQASTIDRPGLMYVNNSEISNEKESMSLNSAFKVPYQPNDTFFELKKELYLRGKDFGYDLNCIYYKEGIIYDKELMYKDFGYNEELSKITDDNPNIKLDINRLYFGIKGSFSKDKNANECIQYDNLFGENILIVAEDNDSFNRQLAFINFQIDNFQEKLNGKDNTDRCSSQVILGSFHDNPDDSRLNSESKLNFPKKARVMELDENTFDYLSLYEGSIKLAVKTDKAIKTRNIDTLSKAMSLYKNVCYDECTVEYIRDILKSNGIDSSDKSLIRLIVACNIINNELSIRQLMNLASRDEIKFKVTKTSTGINEDTSFKKSIGIMLRYLILLNVTYDLSKPITRENTPVKYVIITSLHEINGIQKGDDPKTQEKFSRLLENTSETNIRYILLTKISNKLRTVCKGINYVLYTKINKDLLDSFNNTLETTNPQLPEGVCSIYNRTTHDVKKFLEFRLEKDKL